VIALDGDEAIPADVQVVRLRATPDGAADSIYRYDRAALIGALHAAKGKGRG
jgi:hypothetical protein